MNYSTKLMSSEDKHDNGSKDLSNMGRLFAIGIASKLVSTYELPATFLGLIQVAAEDVWRNAQVYNYSVAGDFVAKHVPSVDIKFTMDTDRYVDLLAQYWHLIVYLILFLYAIRAAYRYVTNMSFDGYHCTLWKTWYNTRMLGQYTMSIMDSGEQKMVINKYLVRKNMFIDTYDEICMFAHKYNTLPEKTAQQFIDHTNTYIPDMDRRHYFNDTEHSVKGYVKWSSQSFDVVGTKNSIKNTERGDVSLSESVNFTTSVPILTVVANIPVSDYLKKIKLDLTDASQSHTTKFAHIDKGIDCEHNYVRSFVAYTYTGSFDTYFKNRYASGEARRFIDTFFHPVKKDIWPKLKAIHFDPHSIYDLGQYPQSAMCLYGPPGTGKSSFPYRVARALGRSLISVDLRCIKKNSDLRRLLGGTTIPTTTYSHLSTTPSNVIFVFDEFDKAIVALNARSKLKAERERKRMNTINSYTSGYGSDDWYSGGYGGYGGGYTHGGGYSGGYTATVSRPQMLTNASMGLFDSDSDSDDVSTETESEAESDSHPAEELEQDDLENLVSLLDSADEVILGKDKPKKTKGSKSKKSKAKKVTIRKPKKSQAQKLREQRKKAKERAQKKKDKVLKTINETDDSDELTVESLLDIIQGPCANHQAIMFATTNEYDAIQKICPRLFRDGRFKPIYFGYPNRETINEITMHFYKQNIMGADFDFIPEGEVRISTARLTGRATDSKFCRKTDESQFQYFIDHLKHDIENYKLSNEFTKYEKRMDTDLHTNDTVSGASVVSDAEDSPPIDLSGGILSL